MEMSICSDVFITREEAEKMVKSQLMYEQEMLIDNAIKGMSSLDLSGLLNRDSDLYYYNIEGEFDDLEDDDEEE